MTYLLYFELLCLKEKVHSPDEVEREIAYVKQQKMIQVII